MQRWSRLGKAVRDSTASHSRSLSSSTSTGTSAASTPATTTVASAGRVNPDHRAASLAFAAWLQQHGLKGYSQLTQPHDSAVASTPRVLGFGIKQSVHNDWQLVASCPIAANQPILSLPLSLTVPLDDRYGRGYSALDPLVKLVPQQLWQLQLGMRLLSERTKQYSTTAATASFYQPYIDLLPLAYTTPLFYQRDDVLALQYPPMQQQINKRSRLLSTLSQAITANQRSASSDAFHGQSISPSLLGWAMSAVSSRAFSFHSHRRLLPLIDMANHSFTPSTRIEATDTHPAAITMYATRDLQPGDELTISYGPHSNDAYLIDYGFVIDDNPYDDLLLTFDLNNVQLALELIGESGADVLRLDGWRQRLVDGMDRSDFPYHTRRTRPPPHCTVASALDACRLVTRPLALLTVRHLLLHRTAHPLR